MILPSPQERGSQVAQALVDAGVIPASAAGAVSTAVRAAIAESERDVFELMAATQLGRAVELVPQQPAESAPASAFRETEGGGLVFDPRNPA